MTMKRGMAFAGLAVLLLVAAVFAAAPQADAGSEKLSVTDAYYLNGEIHYTAASSDTYVWAWLCQGNDDRQPSAPVRVVNGKAADSFPVSVDAGEWTLHVRSATDPGVYDELKLEIVNQEFTISGKEMNLEIGDSGRISASAEGVIWTSSDESVASVSVDENGAVIRGEGSGRASIIASQKNNVFSASCSVGVFGAIKFESTSITMYKGDTKDIGVLISGMSFTRVDVSSDDSDIVTVTKDLAKGRIVLKAIENGSTTVYAYSKDDEGIYARLTVTVVDKPLQLNEYRFFIQITKDFDKADCRPYTEADLRAGIKISAMAYNAAEALEKACREKGIDYSAYSGASGSQDLKGWINSMFGLVQYQGPEDMSLWTYWAQYKDGIYNQMTLGYYTEGGDFQIIWKTTDEKGNDVPSGGESGKTEVKTDENGNKVTTTTNSEKKEDGTTVSSKTETVVDKDGNLLSKTETKTEERPDGSKASSVEKTENIKKDDGTEAVEKTGTETVTDKDGNLLSKTETSDTEEKRPDGTVVKTNTENVIEKDSSGKVLNETRTEKTEETGAGGTVISESYEKKADGKSTESRSIVSKAADGSAETKVEATIVDGKIEKAESTTVIAPSEGKVGADAAKAAVERSADAISRAGIDEKDVEKTFEVSGASVSVEPGALGAIADHGAGLRFSASEKDSVHLDGDACRSLSGEDGAIDLSMSEGQEKDLLDAQKGAVGDRFFIVLDAVVGDKRIHDLGGKASVSFGYTPAEGENVSKLRVWYVDDEGNRHVVEGSLYDPEMGGFTMELTHFSVYMVAEDSSASSPEPEPSGDDDEGSGSSSIAIAAIAVVIIAAIVAVAVIRMRKA